MDKETLSNYGWIVICVLVLAVMLALATPFGKFISNAIENTTTALFQTSKAGLGSAGIDAGELVFGKQDGGAENPDTPDASDKLIPDGGIYKKADGTTLEGNGTNEFPETPADGDEYEYGDYIYKYNQYSTGSSWSTSTSQNGWGIRVKDTSKTTYGEIISEIAGKPVNTMSYTFSGCTSLTTAPAIPDSVTDMSYTFRRCTSITTAPAIPNSVTSMSNTFRGCTFLKTYVGSTDSDGDFSNYIIPSSVTDMTNTFEGCSSLTTAPVIPNSVTNMSSTFSRCSSLTTAPVIPNSVTDMSYTFNGCTSLTKAPTIPNSVTDMERTFSGCTSLTGTIEVNANPDSYTNCLKSTQITAVTGSCSQETKDALMATK